MSGKMSRNKGSGFELEVSKSLSIWSGFKFERVPASGGLHWKEDNNVSGDIVAPFKVNFPCSIECKKVETDWELDKLLTGTSDIWKWWEQSFRDSKEHGDKYPWLVFSKNRRKKYLAVDYQFYNKHSRRLGSIPKILVARGSTIEIVIMDFEQFLSKVDIWMICPSSK